MRAAKDLLTLGFLQISRYTKKLWISELYLSLDSQARPGGTKKIQNKKAKSGSIFLPEAELSLNQTYLIDIIDNRE